MADLNLNDNSNHVFSTVATGWTEYNTIHPAMGTLTVACSHEVCDEAELMDGSIRAACSKCGDRISGRRLPGGLGLLRLKAALVEAIGDPGYLPALAEELERVELLLQVEEEAIEDGRRLILTAKKMLVSLLGRDD